MTVIAWDGKTLAADKQMGADFPRRTTKIRRSKKGELLGVAGFMDRGIILMDWWEAGADPAKFPAFQADEKKSCSMLIIKPDRTLWYVFEEPVAILVEEPFHSIGSGRDFAAATMYLGHDARKAVEVASALCGYCGFGIDTLEL